MAIDVEYKEPEEFGLTQFGNSNDEILGDYDQVLKSAVQTAGELTSGKIPQDVQDQVSQIAAEKSLKQGIGMGSAARNMELRDMGLTSMQATQAGLQATEGIGRLVETRREFDKSYDLNISTFQNQVRGLDLNQEELNLEKDMFNAKQTLLVNKMLTDMAMFSADLVYKYTAGPLEGDTSYAEPSVDSLEQMMRDLEALL